MRRALLAFPLVLALLGLPPAGALASRTQESVLLDSADIIGGSDRAAEAAVLRARAIGFTRLRIPIRWSKVAPRPDDSKLKLPSLPDPAKLLRDPAAYPRTAWHPYDRAIRLARANGLEVYVEISGFAPRWATEGRLPGRLDYIYKIDPAAWRAFAEAVGTRYSGRYPAEDGSGILPRIAAWSLYNEPNQGGWIAPQFERSGLLGGRIIPASPRIYRELVYAGHAGLAASGHGGDLIMIGELAPTGRDRRGIQSPMRPLLFLRELFCLDRRYRPYRGREARARGCAAFRRIPGGAFAVHPYGLTLCADGTPPSPDDLTLRSIGRLARVLDAAARYGRVMRRMPIWSTEYGWQTRPDPFLGISPERHADYMMQAEYLSWRNPRLRSFSQYLLRDDPKRPGEASERKAWGSWQSGLFYVDGRPKPALLAVQLPVQALGRGPRFRIWGMVRPGDGTTRLVQIQHKPRVAGAWRDAGPRFEVGGRGYFARRAGFGRGYWRFVWVDAPGGPKPSRPVLVE